VLLAPAGAEEKAGRRECAKRFCSDIKIIVMTLFSRRAYTNAI
jgi:hypothetical protein